MIRTEEIQPSKLTWKMAAKTETVVVVSYQHGSAPSSDRLFSFRWPLVLTGHSFISDGHCLLFKMLYTGLVMRLRRTGRLVVRVDSLVVTGQLSTATFWPSFTRLVSCCCTYNLIRSSINISGSTAGTATWFTFWILNTPVLQANSFVWFLTFLRNRGFCLHRWWW